jgi:type II secretory pathway pseudopilin PulG
MSSGSESSRQDGGSPVSTGYQRPIMPPPPILAAAQPDVAAPDEGIGNDSGRHAGVPAQIGAFRWHWGAFCLPWLWMLNHRMVALGVTMLLVWLASNGISIGPLRAFVALCLFGASVYLALNGHKLAWRNRRFEGGVPQYLQVERAWSNWGIGVSVCIPVPLILAAILFPVFAQARLKAREVASESNLKQIGLAIAQYELANNDRLPPMDTFDHFKSAVYPYVKSDVIFVQPGEDIPYTLVSDLSHESAESIQNPDSQAVLRDSVPHAGLVATLYADGRVHMARIADPSGADTAPNASPTAGAPAGGN